MTQRVRGSSTTILKERVTVKAKGVVIVARWPVGHLVLALRGKSQSCKLLSVSAPASSVVTTYRVNCAYNDTEFTKVRHPNPIASSST